MRASKSEQQQAAQVAQEVIMAKLGGSVCPVHDAFAASGFGDKDRYFVVARRLGYNVRKMGGSWYESEDDKSCDDGN